MTVGISN